MMRSLKRSSFAAFLRMRSSTAGEGSMLRKLICNGICIARPSCSSLTVMGRDGLRHLAGQVPRQRVRYVAEAHHADQLLRLIEHGKPPDLVVLHDANGVLRLFSVAAKDEILAHHVFRQQRREVLAVGKG